MTLSNEEGKLFYRLWLPLLDYVNERYKVKKSLCDMAHSMHIDPLDVKAVSNKLLEDLPVIDDYLTLHPELPEDHKEIIRSWKHSFSGKFLMDRHLKKGTIFISFGDEKVYLVLGIISEYDEMFEDYPMPLIVDATLMPFKNVIITDGLIVPYNVILGSNMNNSFKEIYMNAKKNGSIMEQL